MLKIENIKIIQKSSPKGYEIVFNDDRKIILHKRRTIIALLLLIKYSECSEADLAGGNTRLQDVKKFLKGRYEENWIQDRYGDSNKPFSELWTEEGFSFIGASGLKGNQKYKLNVDDHEKLFNKVYKADRKQLSTSEKNTILNKQHNKCNICGSILKPSSDISLHTFAKDRVKTEFDHRIPVDKEGGNKLDNYQALCHYCNKCKRQMCFVCELKECNPTCALVYPENFNIVLATNEDIFDRITNK